MSINDAREQKAWEGRMFAGLAADCHGRQTEQNWMQLMRMSIVMSCGGSNGSCDHGCDGRTYCNFSYWISLWNWEGDFLICYRVWFGLEGDDSGTASDL